LTSVALPSRRHGLLLAPSLCRSRAARTLCSLTPPLRTNFRRDGSAAHAVSKRARAQGGGGGVHKVMELVLKIAPVPSPHQILGELVSTDQSQPLQVMGKESGVEAYGEVGLVVGSAILEPLSAGPLATVSALVCGSAQTSMEVFFFSLPLGATEPFGHGCSSIGIRDGFDYGSGAYPIT
jgi:hypothetical protein